MNYQQDNQVDFLLYAEYAYNLKPYLAYSKSPIKVAYSINPKGFNRVLDKYQLRQPPTNWDKDAKALELRRQVAGRLTRWHEAQAIAKETLEYA